jgi:hypothetical protein
MSSLVQVAAGMIKSPSFSRSSSSIKTLNCSIFGDLSMGDAINLEKALRLNQGIDGHLVSGHVDGQGEVTDKALGGESMRFRINVAQSLVKYIASKGSITVNRTYPWSFVRQIATYVWKTLLQINTKEEIMDSHICFVISKMKYMILLHSNEYLKCINVLTNSVILLRVYLPNVPRNLLPILFTSCYFTCTCLVLEISLFGSIVVFNIVVSFYIWHSDPYMERLRPSREYT